MHFKHTTLRNLGLCVQLVHSVGDACANPKLSLGDDFVLLDTHGIHTVGVDYCGCETAQMPYIQLLRN